jgi:hippurate hydrolase
MIDDGVFDRVGRPDVVLGQHVGPLPAGMLGLRRGPAFAGADMLHIVLHGRGGHGSRPETTVDPVVMAAATVMRLQTVVSREVAGGESAVVTVGALHAGQAGNVIPDRAEMRVSLRSYDPDVRTRLMSSIERIVRAEAAASGAPQDPEVILKESFPVLVNDHDAGARTIAGWDRDLGAGLTIDPGAVTGSEDVGMLATAAGVPLVYWLLGGADPAAFAGVTDRDGLQRVVRDLPSNHSPQFAPVIEPTLSTGVKALVSAARTWLPAQG